MRIINLVAFNSIALFTVVLAMPAWIGIESLPRVFAQEQAIMDEQAAQFAQEHTFNEDEAAQYEHLIPEAPEGAVAWQTLRNVEGEIMEDEDGYNFIRHEFAEEIAALDDQKIRIKGFMIPLEMAEKQSRFLLAAYPPSCPFCLPAGPTQLIEVICERPVTFTFNPVLIEGRLKLLQDDPYGLLYRMVDSRQAAQ